MVNSSYTLHCAFPLRQLELPVGGSRHSGSEFCALFWRSRLVRTSKAIPTLTSTEAAKLLIAVSLQKTSWKSGRQPRANTRPWRRRPAMCKPEVFFACAAWARISVVSVGGSWGLLVSWLVQVSRFPQGQTKAVLDERRLASNSQCSKLSQKHGFSTVLQVERISYFFFGVQVPRKL